MCHSDISVEGGRARPGRPTNLASAQRTDLFRTSKRRPQSLIAGASTRHGTSMTLRPAYRTRNRVAHPQPRHTVRIAFRSMNPDASTRRLGSLSLCGADSALPRDRPHHLALPPDTLRRAIHTHPLVPVMPYPNASIRRRSFRHRISPRSNRDDSTPDTVIRSKAQRSSAASLPAASISIVIPRSTTVGTVCRPARAS